MLHAIQQSQRESAAAAERTVEVGPFLATFDKSSPNPHRNYAVLDADQLPTPADVADLVEVYESRGLVPRLELLGPPESVVEALVEGGFTVAEELPLLTLDAAALRPRSSSATIVIAQTRDEFNACAAVQNSAYGEGVAGDDDVDRLQATAARGGWVALATLLDGTPVGSGLATVPAGGLSTLAAIGVLEGHRQAGIASSVVTVLAQQVLAAGATPWLECESDNESRLYGKLGFKRVGSELVLIYQG